MATIRLGRGELATPESSCFASYRLVGRAVARDLTPGAWPQVPGVKRVESPVFERTVTVHVRARVGGHALNGS